VGPILGIQEPVPLNRRRRNILSFGDSGHEREALIKSTARHTQGRDSGVILGDFMGWGPVIGGLMKIGVEDKNWIPSSIVENLPFGSMMFDEFPRFCSLMFPGYKPPLSLGISQPRLIAGGCYHIVISGYYKSVEAAVQQLEKTPMRSCSGCG